MDLDQELHNVTKAIKLQKKRLGIAGRSADSGLLKAHLKKQYGVTISRRDRLNALLKLLIRKAYINGRRSERKGCLRTTCAPRQLPKFPEEDSWI